MASFINLMTRQARAFLLRVLRESAKMQTSYGQAISNFKVSQAEAHFKLKFL
jgi:hypothetical protein